MSKVSLPAMPSKSRIKSVSAFSNYVDPTKSQIVTERQHQNKHQYLQWYSNLSHHKYANRLPSYIHQNTQSIPYRLIINRIYGISPPRKVQKSDILTIKLMGSLFTTDGDSVGQTFSYICQQPLVEPFTKHSVPIIMYYHSKIDKTLKNVILVISVFLLQIRNAITLNSIPLGIIPIYPFEEEQNKTVTLLKNISQIQLINNICQSSKSSINLTYTLTSCLQLKKVTKFFPSELIVSHQNRISGIADDYLPSEQRIRQIGQSSSLEMNIKSIQIHIPEKFQQEVINLISKIPLFSTNPIVTAKKIICGFHNEYKIVSPTIRLMQFLEKEGMGDLKVNVYEANDDRDSITIPYYITNYQQSSMFVIGLIFEINRMEVEIAFHAFTPKLNGDKDEVNESMICRPGMGIRERLLGVNYSKKPTLILQYQCETIVQGIQEEDHSNYFDSRKKTSIHQTIGLRQELQRQKLSLNRQKEQLIKLKTEQHIRYEEDFEKKLQEERDALYKKQQRIQEYYKQQMENQITNKIQLEKQITLMKQKLQAIQNNLNQPSKVPSSDHSHNQSQSEFVPPAFQPLIRHYVDNAHLIDPQPSIPIAKLRQILQTQVPQNLKVDYEAYRDASLFRVTISSIKWINTRIPSRMYFIIHFFNYSQFKSDLFTYQLPLQQVQISREFISIKRLRLDDSRQPTCIFKVDPSTHHSPSLLQRDLVDYLAKNCMIIDVFDGQSELYLGQSTIKLKQLLRGNKKQALIAKQYGIKKIVDGKDNNGFIQVLIENQQCNCKENVDQKMNKVGSRTKKQMKRKILSNAPCRVPSEYQQENPNQQKLSRQQERIKNFKKAHQTYVPSFQDAPQSQKPILFQTINAYKSKNINNYLKDIYSSFLSTNIQITTNYGKSQTFVHEFINNSQSSSSFKINIDGGDELYLVNNAAQWRYFVKKYKHLQPKNYEIINEGWVFYLNSGESIPLLFKYLSFTHKEHASYNITITKEDNMMMVDGFVAHVQHHQPITHHSYILYQPGEQTVDIILPLLYSPTAQSNQERVPFITIDNVKAQFLNEYEILLRMKTPQIMKSVSFNLLLYSDKYFDCLIENWKIKVISYQGVYTVSRPQGPTKFKISLPEQFKNETIRLYTSDTLLQLYIENSSKDYWCQIDYWDNMQMSNQNRKVEISCIDMLRKSMIYGWIVNVLPYSLRKV